MVEEGRDGAHGNRGKRRSRRWHNVEPERCESEGTVAEQGSQRWFGGHGTHSSLSNDRLRCYTQKSDALTSAR